MAGGKSAPYGPERSLPILRGILAKKRPQLRVSSETGNRRELQPGLDTGAWIEIIAQSIADEVEAQHGQHDGERGKQHQMRRVEQMSAAVVEHGSPGRGWRRDAETEKAHGGFGEDGSGHPDRGLHNYWLN